MMRLHYLNLILLPPELAAIAWLRAARAPDAAQAFKVRVLHQ